MQLRVSVIFCSKTTYSSKSGKNILDLQFLLNARLFRFATIKVVRNKAEKKDGN